VLPEQHRLKRRYRVVVGVILLLIAALGVYGGVTGLIAGGAG
jgi:hypothetical protein